MHYRLLFSLCLLLYTGPFGALQGQTAADSTAVRQAMLDYVEALYQVDSARIYAGVHPELVKRGFWRPADEDSYKDMSPMTFEQLVSLAARWNAKDRLPADAPKKVEILDIQDKTASGKLTAHWGTDYFHLAKFDDGWKIVNVLWQSPAPEEE